MNKADRFSKYFEHAKVALPNVIKRIEKHMAEWLSGALSEKRMRSQFGGDESFRPRYDTPDWILKQWLDHPSGGKFLIYALSISLNFFLSFSIILWKLVIGGLPNIIITITVNLEVVSSFAKSSGLNIL